MPQRLKIAFRITLYDWLEFRRAEQSAFRLWLLRLADGSWLPLSFLLAGCILRISLTLSGILSTSIPAWLPLVILVLLASCRIYLSVPSVNRTRLAKNEWKERMANVDCTVELTETGFRYVAGSSTYQPSWTEIGSVFQSEHLLIFCHEDDEDALFMPKRAFGSEEQLQEFLEIAYQKTVSEKR